MTTGESPTPNPDEHQIALAFGVLVMVISIVAVWLIGGFNSLTNEHEMVCTIISKNFADLPPISTSPTDPPSFEVEPQNITTSECGTINVKQGFFSNDLFDDLVVGCTYRLRVADRPAILGSTAWLIAVVDTNCFPR